MFWINLALAGIVAAISFSIARLLVKKPKKRRTAFYTLLMLCVLLFSVLNKFIIKPPIKNWLDQKEINKRLMEVPSYKEVNQQDLEAAHEYFYAGQYGKAAEYYKKALATASESEAELNYRIGLSYYMGGNSDEFMKYWETAKKQKPDIFKLRTFDIPSSSMAPTLITGDYIIVDTEYYKHRLPSRGEVILFIDPQQKAKVFIGRIIGMPEEVIQVKGKDTFINNSKYSDEYANFQSPQALEKPYPETPPSADFGPEKAPKESYFILGDNRNNSHDSRYFGCIHKDLIVGKALAIYVSLAVKDKKESLRPERTGTIIE